jgi:GTPase Era involved in 16S rRNA processing
MVMEVSMFKQDEFTDIQKQQYLDEFGLEQILDNYNAEILKHKTICFKSIELREKRNKLFKLIRAERKEVAPGTLITALNDQNVNR